MSDTYEAQEERLMTTTEVMKWLNLSRTKIWTMIKQDAMPHYKFGGDYRFRRSEILVWMERFRPQNSEMPAVEEGVFPADGKR